MIDLNTSFSIVTQRHADLRAMAQNSLARPQRIQPRHRLGQLLMVIGRWIAGHEPDLLPERSMPETQA